MFVKVGSLKSFYGQLGWNTFSRWFVKQLQSNYHGHIVLLVGFFSLHTGSFNCSRIRRERFACHLRLAGLILASSFSIASLVVFLRTGGLLCLVGVAKIAALIIISLNSLMLCSVSFLSLFCNQYLHMWLLIYVLFFNHIMGC